MLKTPLVAIASSVFLFVSAATRALPEAPPPTTPMPSNKTEKTAATSQELRKLFAEDWELTLREAPVFATSVGDLRFNDRLGSESEDDQLRRLKQAKGLLTRLEAIDRTGLSAEERISYDTFKLLKEHEIAEAEFRAYLMPITNRSGFHVNFPRLRKRVPLETVEHYEDYISRLNAFGLYTDQHIELLRQGVRKGFALPKIVLGGYEEAIEAHIVDDATKSLFFEPFQSFPDKIADEGGRARLKREGERAILDTVVPAYARFLEFMQKEYYPAAREEISCASLPNGKAFYEHRVRRFTTLDITPAAVHEIGLGEVRRIRAEMEGIIKKVGFDGTFQEFLKFLRTDPRFYVQSPEALLKEVAYILKAMDGKLPRLFKKLPRTPYGLEKIPDYIAPKTTSAYYNPPTGDGKRPGLYMLNTYDLKSRPLYEMEALSFHEAVPGHHLQIALQQELEEIPQFRRFNGFTAFVEGWALYSERLGLEVGFYEDPYSDFGRLTFEMWRACRLVVDTGMHYLGWNRQRAIDFMAENTALTLFNITNEVDRYIAWPGQALAYKMGELKIRELRAAAEKELGDSFDLRDFHDVILRNGAVPLGVLEELVAAYVTGAR